MVQRRLPERVMLSRGKGVRSGMSSVAMDQTNQTNCTAHAVLPA